VIDATAVAANIRCGLSPARIDDKKYTKVAPRLGEAPIAAKMRSFICVGNGEIYSMTNADLSRLRCPGCGRVMVVGHAERLAALQQIGMLKKAKNPEPDLVAELFQTSIERIPCLGCGASGLLPAWPGERDDGEWPQARACEVCKKPIGAERLEVFPTATRCAACQNREARGEAEEVDYCPKCGSIREMRPAPSRSGSYRMFCPSCRR